MSKKLFEAIENNDRKEVKKLLDGSWFRFPVNINAYNKNGNTPLIQAIKDRKFKMVEDLLSRGADPTTESKSGQFPAGLVADAELDSYDDSCSGLELLVKYGVDLTALDNHGRSVLNYIQGDYEFYNRNWSGTMKYLVEHGVNVNIPGIFDGMTPLMAAVRKGSCELVKLILEHGADINAQDKKGQCAIMDALSGGNEKIIDLLLQYNPNLNLKDRYGTPIIFYISNPKQIVTLKKAGMDLDAQTNTGNTFLIHACEDISSQSIIDTCEILLENGANPNIRGEYGNTALMRIISAWSVNVLPATQLICKYGVDLNIQNNNGETALILAAEYKKADVVKYLVEQGCDLNLRDDKGQTAAIVAAKRGKDDVLKYLIENGCDLSIKDNDGKTVYHYASDEMLIYLNNSAAGKGDRFPQSEEKDSGVNTESQRKTGLYNQVEVMSGTDLFNMTENDTSFVERLMITGLLINALTKMSYDETMTVYKKTQEKLSPEMCLKVQDVIRHKR